jgi:Mg-chelatase subunit ChlD
MQAIATTLLTVLRGTTTDAYGDDQDTDTVVQTSIPASLTEQSRRVTTRDNPTPRIVRYAVARVAAGTDIRDQDRVRDERTGAVYIVDAPSSMANPAMAVDLRLDLRRTT